MSENSDIFKNLVLYLNENTKILFDFVECKGEFIDDSLETIVNINKNLRKPRIKYVIFKVGALYTNEQGHKLRKFCGYRRGDANLAVEEYKAGVKKIRYNIEHQNMA